MFWPGISQPKRLLSCIENIYKSRGLRLTLAFQMIRLIRIMIGMTTDHKTFCGSLSSFSLDHFESLKPVRFALKSFQ